MSKYVSASDPMITEVGPTVLLINGLIDTLSVCSKMISFYIFSTYIDGNIETCFANMSKMYEISIPCAFYTPSHPNTGKPDWLTTVSSDLVSGNINVLGDKYDLKTIEFQRHKNIAGEAKSLKNLKKLWHADFRYSSCTGSKTDLYNNGANVYDFRI